MGKKKYCSHQCLHWWQEQSTGLFRVDGFEFLACIKEADSPNELSAYLAPQKEFESPTFRLGGGRSILLSYKRIYDTVQTDYRLPFCKGVC